MRSRRDATVLFHDGQLFEWLARREAEMYSEVERLDEERLLASSVDTLVANRARLIFGHPRDMARFVEHL